jgi:hypothetical protein
MKFNSWTLLFLSALLLAGCGKSPESTVESFYRAVGKGEITEAQGYISAQLVGMVGSGKIASALAKESEKIGACGGIKSVDVKLKGEGEIRSGTATITYAGKCQPNTEKTKLVKEDGKWKISAEK